jgi:uncharacterized protein YndB with AHSA1/START domain
MAYQSGNGGEVLVGAVTLHVGKWTLRKTSRNVDNTHSGVTSSNYEHVVPDHSATLEIPWDDTNIPDTDAGLAEGVKVTLTMNLGSTAKTQVLTNTLVESVEDVCDNSGDIIRTVVTVKGGSLTRALT